MPDSPIILAIETATGPCSAAVWKAGKVAAYAQDMRTVTQSVSLMPMVERVLAESKTDYKDLTLVAASVGPGSFTGIRVGLAAARGICFSAGIAGVGINTLDILAFAAALENAPSLPLPTELDMGGKREKNILSPACGGELERGILAILNAGKGEVYSRLYSPPFAANGETQVGTLELALAGAHGALVASNVELPEGTLRAEATFPRADTLAKLVASHGKSFDIGMHPFYLRAPDAKLPS